MVTVCAGSAVCVCGGLSDRAAVFQLYEIKVKKSEFKVSRDLTNYKIKINSK